MVNNMIKNPKKKIMMMFFVLIMMSILLSGCDMPNRDNLYDDTEAIIENENAYSILKSASKTENNTLTKSVESSSGIETIWKYNSDQDETIEMNYKLNVSKGSVKLVLITGSDKIIDLVELSEGDSYAEQSKLSLSTEKGLNSIKIITKNRAGYEFSITTFEGSYEK